jgi:predicted RNase H-like nuclease (RuvC/YqgF family)
MSVEKKEAVAHLTARNIGGIDQTEVVFEPGVTILSGRNATNRTSLLQAIMAAHGSDDVSLKADADDGRAELIIDGETYIQTLKRQTGRVHTSGEPYLEDSTLADLFAFLLESNEARRAVINHADLRDIIMRPVDTDKIRTEIDRLVEKRREIDDELDELEDPKNRLPSLEEERTQLQARVEEKKTELEDVEAEIEAADVDVEQSHEEQAELETKLAELREKRSDLEDVRYEFETEQKSLDSLHAEEREVETAYGELPETPAGDIDELETRIDQLRIQEQDLESGLNELQAVIDFNQERLEDGADESRMSSRTGTRARWGRTVVG